APNDVVAVIAAARHAPDDVVVLAGIAPDDVVDVARRSPDDAGAGVVAPDDVVAAVAARHAPDDVVATVRLRDAPRRAERVRVGAGIENAAGQLVVAPDDLLAPHRLLRDRLSWLRRREEAREAHRADGI